MSELINVTRSSIPEFEEYCAEIRSMWDSHWLTNMGEKHQRLEAALQDYLGVEHAVLLTNGRGDHHLAFHLRLHHPRHRPLWLHPRLL